MSKKLENLIAGHAYWSDRKSQLKKQGAKEAESCEKTANYNWLSNKPFPKTCIETAFNSRNKQFDGYGGPDFNDVWNEMIGDGEICQHCINVRALKRKRMIASRRLGCIRAAITKAGRNFEYSNPAN
tara:strand:+ start:37091 stop:37471 length:381 start_codon:yes stop_codon:yes gene_type:complete